jgi:Protein of unknown function, DUF481
MNARLHGLTLPVAALAALLVSTAAFARGKSDVIHLVNGDRITGEIVELAYGELKVKTDSLGTVEIEWPDVVRIDSPHTFSVETQANVRYFGHIGAAPEPGRILVTTNSGHVVLGIGDIARVGQIEAGFIDRLNGSISLGFDQTKSSDTSRLTFGFDTEYRSERFNTSLAGSYTSNTTPSDGTFNQYQVESTTQFLRPGDRFWLALASFESNEQQGIDGRLLAGGATGKYLIRNQDSELATFAGLAFTQEWATLAADDQQSAEGVLGLQWKVFRFKDPETTLTSKLLVLPSLTQTGRYRATADISLSYEIINDLDFVLSLNSNYDSDPPTAGSDTLDYSLSTSLAYKF